MNNDLILKYLFNYITNVIEDVNLNVCEQMWPQF